MAKSRGIKLWLTTPKKVKHIIKSMVYLIDLWQYNDLIFKTISKDYTKEEGSKANEQSKGKAYKRDRELKEVYKGTV